LWGKEKRRRIPSLFLLFPHLYPSLNFTSAAPRKGVSVVRAPLIELSYDMYKLLVLYQYL